jgi:hypothetical protein
MLFLVHGITNWASTSVTTGLMPHRSIIVPKLSAGERYAASCPKGLCIFPLIFLPLIFLLIGLLIGGKAHGQSLADAARANRKQKAVPTKVLTSDDLVATSTPEIIQLIPGSSSTGQGTLVAPGRGRHSYRVILLDASRFANGGTIHITITVGGGESEASFDLYPQGLPLPSEGFPNSLAIAVNIHSVSGAKINYRFAHGTVFQFGAEGSWNAKAGATNTYSFVVDVGSQSTQ